MLSSIFAGTGITTVSFSQFAITSGVALVLGIIIMFAHSYKSNVSKTIKTLLIVLPFIVEVIIMVVNGNLGAGVAVAGAFTLIRFRSVKADGKELASIFLAVAAGIALGMGYILVAVIMVVVVLLIFIIMGMFKNDKGTEKQLRITIPESLDYSGIFDDIFNEYTDKCEFLRVKTVNMGSLYELRYRVHEKDESKEKEMLDKIRTRNGNLQVMCGRMPENGEEL